MEPVPIAAPHHHCTVDCAWLLMLLVCQRTAVERVGCVADWLAGQREPPLTLDSSEGRSTFIYTYSIILKPYIAGDRPAPGWGVSHV